MSVAAKSSAPAFVSGEQRTSSFESDIALLTAQQASVSRGLAEPNDHYVMLYPKAILGDGETTYTTYFEACRPMDILALVYPGSTIPGGFSTLTAEVLVTRGGVEVSGMLDDTPVSIFAGTRTVLTLEESSTADDEDQLYYLAQGDKMRVKFVSTGSSGEIAPTDLPMQVILRER